MTTDDQIQAIKDQFIRRAAAQGLKPKSAAYRRAEVEFFCGVMAAFEALFPNTENPQLQSPAIPASWTIRIMTGRPLATD